jgi:hypothetical protein
MECSFTFMEEAGAFYGHESVLEEGNIGASTPGL